MDSSAYRERVYEAFADTDADVSDRVDHALEVGAEYLQLEVGFLTRIYDGTQEIVQAIGGHDLIQPGETCPLDEAYCRRTITRDSPLAVQDAAASAAVSETAIQAFGLGTYIGARVMVDGEVYGTICFADDEERGRPFTEAEELFIELLGELVGQTLERRAHEQELRQRNERLRAEKRRFEGIAETSSDILFRVDHAAEFTYVSEAAERILGHQPEEMVGREFPAFVDDSSQGDAMAGYSKVLDGQPVEGLVVEFVDADGETVVIEVNATPIVEDGAVVGVQGVGRDVTGRQARERELRIKNRAMDEANIGMTIADAQQPDTPLVYVNDGFERVTGYETADALGRNCRFLQGEATAPGAVDLVQERIDDGEPVSTELINYRRDGPPFWNGLRIGPITDDDGEVTHFLGFQEDITERKRTEQLVRLLNRVLRHNLRNDMNVILGSGQLLRDADGEQVSTLADRITATAEDLVSLSEQARELERVAQRDRRPRRLDPGDLLERVAATQRDRFGDATVDLEVATDRDLCAGSELARALSELVENALKHGGPDDPWVRITVEDDPGSDCLRITVEDEGPGISEMETRVISKGEETPLEHGTGLGLWLVNWIVTRYGGSFQVRQRGGDSTGSVATITLPEMGPETTVEEAARPPTVLSR